VVLLYLSCRQTNSFKAIKALPFYDYENKCHKQKQNAKKMLQIFISKTSLGLPEVAETWASDHQL